MTDTLVYNSYDTTGEEEARDVWRSLPIAEAYPVGSRWVHPSHTYPVTITGHRDDRTVTVRYSEPGTENGEHDWPRGALDTYGRPARGDRDNAPAATSETFATSETPDVDTSFNAGDRVRIVDAGSHTHGSLAGTEATYVGFSPYRDPPFNPYEVRFDAGTEYGFFNDDGSRGIYAKAIEHVDTTPEPEPRAIAVGDRVRVTVDNDEPENVGKAATVLEIQTVDGYTHRVSIDGFRYSSWWVAGVELEDETTSELETETPELAPYPINAGDRVRLIDAGGDAGSTAVVGDLGTATNSAGAGYDLLYVRMDDGHNTSRNAHRWEKVTGEAAEPVTPEPVVTYSQEDVDRLTREAADVARREGREAATREAAARMETIVESAHEYARDNSLCGQFDRFMVANGLEPRDTWEGIEYDVTVTFTVTGRDEDDAKEKAQDYMRSGYVDSYNVDVEES